MRPITTIACSILFTVPLVVPGVPARADNSNSFLGQAQVFFNNNGDNDRNSYKRGREDEMRRQQAERDRDHYHRDRVWGGNDRDRPRYHGYSNNYR